MSTTKVCVCQPTVSVTPIAGGYQVIACDNVPLGKGVLAYAVFGGPECREDAERHAERLKRRLEERQ